MLPNACARSGLLDLSFPDFTECDCSPTMPLAPLNLRRPHKAHVASFERVGPVAFSDLFSPRPCPYCHCGANARGGADDDRVRDCRLVVQARQGRSAWLRQRILVETLFRKIKEMIPVQVVRGELYLHRTSKFEISLPLVRKPTRVIWSRTDRPIWEITVRPSQFVAC
jgi:hypothetical protein